MRRCLLKGDSLPCLIDRVQLRLRRHCLRLNRLHEICRDHLNVADAGDVLDRDGLEARYVRHLDDVGRILSKLGQTIGRYHRDLLAYLGTGDRDRLLLRLLLLLGLRLLVSILASRRLYCTRWQPRYHGVCRVHLSLRLGQVLRLLKDYVLLRLSCLQSRQRIQ